MSISFSLVLLHLGAGSKALRRYIFILQSILRFEYNPGLIENKNVEIHDTSHQASTSISPSLGLHFS